MSPRYYFMENKTMLFDEEELKKIHFNGSFYTDSLITIDEATETDEAFYQALSESSEKIRAIMKQPSLVKEFIRTPYGPDWISTWYEEKPMQTPSATIKFANSKVEELHIVSGGSTVQEAITKAYLEIQQLADRFGIQLPANCEHTVSMKTSDPKPVRPEPSAYIKSSDYAKDINEYFAEIEQRYDLNGDRFVGVGDMTGQQTTGEGAGVYRAINTPIPYNAGPGMIFDGTAWKTPSPYTSTTTANYTGSYTMFPQKEQCAGVSIYNPNRDLSDPYYKRTEINAQTQWYPNPVDTSEKTQPLTEKHHAWYWLDKNQSCTNGYFTLQPTDIDTLRVYNEDNGRLAMVSAMASKEDRYKELKAFSYELQDISTLEKDTMALDNVEWEAI